MVINIFTKKIEHTSNIINNITRHSHNNYEHNVIKQVNKHIKHISSYTEINCYNEKHLITMIILTCTMVLLI